MVKLKELHRVAQIYRHRDYVEGARIMRKIT